MSGRKTVPAHHRTGSFVLPVLPQRLHTPKGLLTCGYGRLYSIVPRAKILTTAEKGPHMASPLDTPLRARIPLWMAEGLEEVAKRHRVTNTSLVTRWALEDLLRREGITDPETGDQTAA